jgi:hypothetical protein
MSSTMKLCLLLVLATMPWWLAGCGSELPQAAPAAKEAAPPTEEPSDVPSTEAAFSKLSPEDREMAMKQKICPVSDEPLGAMGEPKKVAVAGHEVFICCEACEEKLLADPEQYLAKLGLKPAEATANP